MPLKLVSINIEGSKHLDQRVIPFLKKEKPDVVLLQEVFKEDVEKIEQTLEMNSLFLPMALVKKQQPDTEERDIWGLLLLTRLPILESGSHHYHRYHQREELPLFFSTKNPEQMDRVLGWIQVAHQGKEYTFATTHFTWSKEGKTTDLQLESFRNLEAFLDTKKISVLTGDFNAPRGRKIFDTLSKRFIDNIPSEIDTTIDNELHKAPNEILFVVDGLFSAKDIAVLDVKVVSGVSDHKAISAQIE